MLEWTALAERAPHLTRFAPSPTGHLHIGGARTALFNWALARGSGGSFAIRIEDTDRGRSSEQSARGILDDLAWLGLDWDEGPSLVPDPELDRGPDLETSAKPRAGGGQGIPHGGTPGQSPHYGGDPRGVGPFFQSRRLDHYERAVAELLERDLAYPSFETPAELEILRQRARAEKRNFCYRRPSDYDVTAARERMARQPYVLRFHMPHQSLRIHDALLGDIDFGSEQLDDFVLRKRDGFPTYHLAVVVDDALMGISHVVRGQEHLNNTPRQVALQRALGFPQPQYIHLPLIFNPDGSKMSKRDKDKAGRRGTREALARGDPALRARLDAAIGAEPLDRWLADKRRQLEPNALARLAEQVGVELPGVDVEDFRRAGYLPGVLCNYLALLGWNPGRKNPDGSDLERFDRAFLVRELRSGQFGVANARFDRRKLEAFNRDTLAALPLREFTAHWLAWCRRYDPDALEFLRDPVRQRRFAALMQPRSKTLADPTRRDGPGGFALHRDTEIPYDSVAVARFLQADRPGGAPADGPIGFPLLRELEALLRDMEPFIAPEIEAKLRVHCDARGIDFPRAAQALRVAVAGRPATPPLGDTMAFLGRDSVLRRLTHAGRTRGTPHSDP